MKYLKITMAIFVGAVCLNMMGVNASTYFVIQGIKVPILSNNWISKEAMKGHDGGEQKIKKVSCTDDVSGDGRVLLGQVMIMFDSGGTTDPAEIPQGKNVSFGKATIEAGSYKILIKSKKTLLTTATANINWDIGSLYDPTGAQPYPFRGN